jgi:hypothetical protein
MRRLPVIIRKLSESPKKYQLKHETGLFTYYKKAKRVWRLLTQDVCTSRRQKMMQRMQKGKP